MKRALKIGGRSKVKMMELQKWLELLPKEIREKITIIKASDIKK